MTDDTPDIAVTFNPQIWVDAPNHLDDGAEKQLIPDEDRDPVTFTVDWDDATDDEGNVFPDKSYEANQLRDHPSAPEWVQNWEGPYYVRTKRVENE